MTTGTTTDYLNLRVQPNTRAAVLRILPKGATLDVQDDLGDWLFVTARDGARGYVARAYVTLSDPVPQPQPQPQPTPSPAPTPAPPGGVLLVPEDDFINLRSAPVIRPDTLIESVWRASGPLVALEDRSTVEAKLAAPDSANQWIRVRAPSGREGFVAAWLMDLKDAAPPSGPAAPPTELYTYIDSLTNLPPVPQGYYDFWAYRQMIGLPAPFDLSPTQLSGVALRRMAFNGFGPNSFAFGPGRAWYRFTNQMHSGIDHLVPLGTPLLALSDGVIVGTQREWQFIGNVQDKTLTLWCFLPENIRDARGQRMLSNVLVCYAHMDDNTIVRPGQVVNAGQVIGKSGRMAGQTGNDHLHMEVHLLTGDDSLPNAFDRKLLRNYKRPQFHANSTPFNPILFFSERMVRYYLDAARRPGFGRTAYPTTADLMAVGNFWPPFDIFTMAYFRYLPNFAIWQVRNAPPWPRGIYDLPGALERMKNFTPFEPYPFDFA